MAIKEGRCINCGSILFLDSDMPQGHCLFCDCVFDNEEAFRANEHPEEFTFPNVEQPKYEGPSLTPVQYQRIPVFQAPAVSTSPEKVVEDYILPETKVPSFKIPLKSVLLIMGVAALVIGLFLAIAYPVMGKREKRQTAIIEEFIARLPYEVDKEKAISVHEMGGTDVILVLDEELTAEDSIELFNTYCDVRADVLSLDGSFKKTRKPVTFLVAAPAGGYLIKEPADEAALTPAFVKVLD